MVVAATGSGNHPTDAELLEAARLGSETAFGRLIKRHFGTVYAVAYARMGHRETAEDLTQETFLRAFVCLDRLKESRRFVPWLVRIAHNLATDWQRQARLTTMVPVEEVAKVLRDEGTQNAREAVEGEE